MPPPTPTPEQKAVTALIHAFNTLDPPAIIALRHPTCLRHFLPKSLALTPHTNAQYLSNLQSMKAIFRSFRINVTNTIEGVSATSGRKTVVMYVEAEGETVVGAYRNEYVWCLGFEEGGTGVIVEWSEFVDAVMQREFWPLLREAARREREGRGKEKEIQEGGKEKESK